MLKNAPCWNKLLLTRFSWLLHVNSIHKSTSPNIFPNISFIRSTWLCILLLRYRTKQTSDTLQGSIISVCPSIKVSLHKCWLCKPRQIKPYLSLTNSGIDKLPGFLIFYSVFVNGYWSRHSGKHYPQYGWHWLNAVHFEMEAAKQQVYSGSKRFSSFFNTVHKWINSKTL